MPTFQPTIYFHQNLLGGLRMNYPRNLEDDFLHIFSAYENVT